MKKLIVLLLFTSVVISCKKENKVPETYNFGNITLSTSTIIPGEEFELAYNGTDTLESAYYYYTVNNHFYPEDIDLIQNKAVIKLPDSANAVAFIFSNGDTYDHNNSDGYLFRLYNNKKEEIPGSTASLNYFTINNGSEFGIEANTDSLFKTLTSDLKKHPEAFEKWTDNYVYFLYRKDKVEGRKLFEEKIKEINSKESLNEKDYSNLYNFNNTIGNKETADSLKSIILEKFPKGSFASRVIFEAFGEEKSIDKKIELLKLYKEHSGTDEYIEDYMHQSIANLYRSTGNFEKFNEYTSKISNKLDRASFLNSIAWGYAEKNENLEIAASMSKESLELVKSAENNLEEKPSYYTKKGFSKSLKSSYGMYADTYALILFQQGQVKEAIPYQEIAAKQNKDPDILARYIELLVADKQFEKAKNKAEIYIADGQSSEKMIQFYETAHNETSNHSSFKENLETLLAKAHKKEVEKIKNKLVNKPAPNFTLKDIEGNHVTLSDLKGKTVILDFWATWCGPCIASFPGMQQIVEKYKSNENVVLLFIDTFEDGENREKDVTEFIKEKNYAFHVLYDETIEDSNEFKVAESYGVNAIPTKAIIGPDGNLKYQQAGFGSTEKLIKELDILIELTQNM